MKTLEELLKLYPDNNGLKLLLSRQIAAQPMTVEAERSGAEHKVPLLIDRRDIKNRP